MVIYLFSYQVRVVDSLTGKYGRISIFRLTTPNETRPGQIHYDLLVASHVLSNAVVGLALSYSYVCAKSRKTFNAIIMISVYGFHLRSTSEETEESKV